MLASVSYHRRRVQPGLPPSSVGLDTNGRLPVKRSRRAYVALVTHTHTLAYKLAYTEGLHA